MPTMHGYLAGWGKYVPERVVTNVDLEKQVDTSDAWIAQRTGIRARHLAADGEHTSHMATNASREALEMAGIDPKDLDLIIVATSSPDYLTPPVSSQVQDQLGATDVGAFTLVVGCPGFVYGLVVAQQFITAGTAQRILVVGVELISRMVDWNDRNTCVLFGDGAAAAVMAAREEPGGVMSFVLGSDGSGAEHLILPSGGVAIPPSRESLAAGQNYLKMNGREVFKFATRVMGRALGEALEKANLTVEDIDLFIPHQANLRIIESAARRAGLAPEKVFTNVDKYGNTSAASVPIALCEAYEQGRLKRGDTVAMVAFGAGLSWAAAILKF